MNETFSSVEEELEHWKSKAMQFKASMESAKEELEEYQTSSRELEAELETQLEVAENKIKELVSVNSRLTMEVEGLREKLENQHTTNHRQVSELETKLAKVEAYGDALQKYTRELEQANDDLERAKRAAVVSLEDFELRLNQAIERNAFLESELDEKENLVVCVQRLKDEARDLRHELAAQNQGSGKKHDETDGAVTSQLGDNLQTIADSGTDVQQDLTSAKPQLAESHLDMEVKSEELVNNVDSSVKEDRSPTTPTVPSISAAGCQQPSSPITPASRISALNIVGDLLRKLGALESKLATCRTVDRSLISQYRDSPGSSTQTPAVNRLGDRRQSPSSVQKGYVQITV